MQLTNIENYKIYLGQPSKNINKINVEYIYKKLMKKKLRKNLGLGWTSLN